MPPPRQASVVGPISFDSFVAALACCGVSMACAASRAHPSQSASRALALRRLQAHGAADTPASAAPSQPVEGATVLLAPPSRASALEWTAVQPADVAPFSAAAGAGLPLWTPSGLAITLVALFAARDGRQSRGLAMAELSAFLAERPATATTPERKVVPAEDAEATRAAQRAEAQRREREAAQAAEREAEERRTVEAETARVQAELALAEEARAELRRVLMAEQAVREAREAEVRREAERKAQELAAVRAAEDAARRGAEAAERRRIEEERRREVEADRMRRGIRAVTAKFRGEASISALASKFYEVQLGVRAVGVATQEASERREAHSSQEARSAVAEVCASVARAAVRDYGNDARAKGMLGVGPLTVLDDAELSHWQHLLRVQLEACALDTLSRLTAEVEVLARKSQGKPAQRSAEVAVTVARDIAPLEDSASVRGRLQRAVDAVRSSNADAARVLLGTVVVEERAALVAAPGVDAGKASFYGTLLTLAHFLERADGADEACVALAQDVLLSALNSSDGGSWKSCFLDTDQPELASGACSAATQLLGEEHVLVKALERLSASRAVPPPVEEEWPDESIVRAARIADAQAEQPVPERVWAMRNAAATLAMTGARPQAVALLTRAVQLKVEWLGREDPRVLGELCDLLAYTDAVDAAADVAARILRVCEGAAERQVESGDVQGAIALLLGAASEYGYAHGEAERLRSRAASLGAESSDPPYPGAVRQLAEAQATELEVRRKLR